MLGTINNKIRAIVIQFRFQLSVSGDGYIKRSNERRESPNIIAAKLIAIINYIDLVIST